MSIFRRRRGGQNSSDVIGLVLQFGRLDEIIAREEVRLNAVDGGVSVFELQAALDLHLPLGGLLAQVSRAAVVNVIF